MRDLRVFMRVHEVAEPLYLLEKAAVALAVTRTYANGAYSTKTILVSPSLSFSLSLSPSLSLSLSLPLPSLPPILSLSSRRRPCR